MTDLIISNYIIVEIFITRSQLYLLFYTISNNRQGNILTMLDTDRKPKDVQTRELILFA